MKVISICQNCKGKGKTNFLQFFSRTCPHCNGKGKKVTEVNDFNKKYKSF